MLRQIVLVISSVSALLLCACAGTSGGKQAMTYRQAVRDIGRQPTSASRSPTGELTAVWETEVPGGTRHLIMVFDKDGKLISSRSETRPGSGDR